MKHPLIETMIEEMKRNEACGVPRGESFFLIKETLKQRHGYGETQAAQVSQSIHDDYEYPSSY
jgi:hypothetical protein